MGVCSFKKLWMEKKQDFLYSCKIIQLIVDVIMILWMDCFPRVFFYFMKRRCFHNGYFKFEISVSKWTTGLSTSLKASRKLGRTSLYSTVIQPSCRVIYFQRAFHRQTSREEEPTAKTARVPELSPGVRHTACRSRHPNQIHILKAVF